MEVGNAYEVICFSFFADSCLDDIVSTMIDAYFLIPSLVC